MGFAFLAEPSEGAGLPHPAITSSEPTENRDTTQVKTAIFLNMAITPVLPSQTCSAAEVSMSAV